MSTNHDGPKPGEKSRAADPNSSITKIGKGMWIGTAFSLEEMLKAVAGLEPPESSQDNPNIPEVQSSKSGNPGYSAKQMNIPGFERLATVLQAAYTQAAVGKGVQRHSKHGERFEDQPIFDMAKRFGTGALLAQAFKKMEESQRLDLARASNELYGAMVYCAAAVISLENQWVESATSGK
jgi:hypothetical protein